MVGGGRGSAAVVPEVKVGETITCVECKRYLGGHATVRVADDEQLVAGEIETLVAMAIRTAEKPEIPEGAPTGGG